MEDDMFPNVQYGIKDSNKRAQDIHNNNGYHNEKYQTLLNNFLRCSTEYLNGFPYAQHLEKQLSRLDLDTVCAYEIYQMKKSFTQENTLNLSEFYKKA